MNTYNISTTLLQGLGKSTRRGIKKCQNCGTLNGTRGSFCKNKQCGISLKTPENNLHYDAVKLVTGNFRQVFSVKVKDIISESRGFVQLPQVCNEDSLSVALCFVDSCKRNFDNSILKCHEEVTDKEVCSHINMALKSQIIAKPVHFDKSLIDKLKIPAEMREKLAVFDDNDSPLVQRVSKDVMAVKCQVTPKQPLGYLHFTFVKGKSKVYDKYCCNCTEYLSSESCEKSTSIKYKCIHYYACVAALTANKEYLDEFGHFLHSEISSRTKSVLPAAPIEPLCNVKRSKIHILSNQIVKKGAVMRKAKQKYLIKRCKNIVPKIYPIEIKVLSECSTKSTDNEVSWPFFDWLGFVTESINKTMQFINCGIINTQVFYIPEDFFQALKDRIPNNYQEQKTEISIFYSIMNVNHVKEIFDTPKVKLRIAKKFIHNDQEGYIEYDENSDSDTQYVSSFIFFLNVGQSTVDESDNCNNAFIIEWLPNIFSSTKVGQLKVQYKYGRKSI